jgi:uncharacterized protein (DUF305 family)
MFNHAPLKLSVIAAVTLSAILAFGLSTSFVTAQQHHGNHGSSTVTAESASTKAYREANAKMHKDMDIRFSGNADTDFVRGMIPHHQGAVDMAKIVLANGKDPELRKLASEIIAAQEKELSFMRDWLKKNAK